MARSEPSSGRLSTRFQESTKSFPIENCLICGRRLIPEFLGALVPASVSVCHHCLETPDKERERILAESTLDRGRDRSLSLTTSNMTKLAWESTPVTEPSNSVSTFQSSASRSCCSLCRRRDACERPTLAHIRTPSRARDENADFQVVADKDVLSRRRSPSVVSRRSGSGVGSRAASLTDLKKSRHGQLLQSGAFDRRLASCSGTSSTTSSSHASANLNTTSRKDVAPQPLGLSWLGTVISMIPPPVGEVVVGPKGGCSKKWIESLRNASSGKPGVTAFAE